MSSVHTFRPGPLVRYGLPLAALGILAACSSGGGTSTSATSAAAAAAPTATSSAASGTTSGASTSVAATIEVTGGHLTDATGRTLYLWVADTGPKSTCSGACATVWPPVSTTGSPTAGTGTSASDLSVITRGDGTSQVAYAGHPLYYFEGDKTAGATTGQGNDGFGAKWWEVNASGVAITTAAGGSSPTSPSSATSSGVSGY